MAREWCALFLVCVWICIPADAALPKLSVLVLTKKDNAHCGYVLKEIQRNLKSLQAPLEFHGLDFDPDSPPSAGKILLQNPDLILALSSEPAQWAVESLPDIPVLFSMVYDTDSVEHCLRKHPGAKGVFLNPGADEILPVLKEILPGLRQVGILTSLNSSESLRQLWRSSESRYGVRLRIETVKTPTEFPEALQRIATECDALYLLPDPLILQPSLLKKMVLKGFSNHFFVFGESYGVLKNGVMFSFVYDIEEVSRLTSALLQEYAETLDVSRLQNKRCGKFHLFYNPDVFEKLGLPIPPSVRKKGTPA